MSVGESAVSFPRVAVTCHAYVRRAFGRSSANGCSGVFGSDSEWRRRGLSVSNSFIPLYMADQLQLPEPGDSVGRGPTADHHKPHSTNHTPQAMDLRLLESWSPCSW